MSDHRHIWEMTHIRFGFVAFERCFHCNQVRTFFSEEVSPDLSDDYREGHCYWTRVENAQSFMFDLLCKDCGYVERFDDLMGLLHCTGCLPDCEVEQCRKRDEADRIFSLVAFGFLPQKTAAPILAHKLEILADYFNQRRDTSRSTIKFISSTLIEDLSRCRGDFIHDIGMLSHEPIAERKSLF